MSSNNNIMTASNQYAFRPADERFATLDALIANADADRQMSHEAVYPTRDLRAIAGPRPDGHGDTIRIENPAGQQCELTHYSFGQLCGSIGAPAKYLRTLPPSIGADCLNYGLHERAEHGQKLNILIRDDQNAPFPTARAATSETYGRVWDASLYGQVARWFGDGRPSSQGTWQSPPVWPGTKPGGQYRGDRDSFIIRIDGGSIVDDPRGWGALGSSSSQAGGRLNRGLMIRNSEVGVSSIVIDWVLFDVICGNHILWGAVLDRTFRRRHTGTKINADVMTELMAGARKYNQRAASEDARIIKALVEHEIATTKDAVISELQKMGATKEEATQAYAHAEMSETTMSPRSFWGLAAGLTRYSQESGYQDDRYELDQLAAQVLKKGALQYATV